MKAVQLRAIGIGTLFGLGWPAAPSLGQPSPTAAVSGLEFVPAPGASVRWVEAARVSPFIYRADFRLEQRDQLLAELGELRLDLAQLLALPPSAEMVELYLFRDEAAYRSYLDQRFGDLPRRRALYIKAGGPGMVYAFRGDEFAVDLRHETTHALLHGVLAGLPLWLDEGLAEYFEVPRGARVNGNPHLEETRARLRQFGPPPLAALEAIDDVAAMRRETYVDAWAWVHFLQHGPPAARTEFVAYLSDLQQRRSTAPLGVRLRRRLPQLERQFAAHFDASTAGDRQARRDQ